MPLKSKSSKILSLKLVFITVTLFRTTEQSIFLYIQQIALVAVLHAYNDILTYSANIIKQQEFGTTNSFSIEVKAQSLISLNEIILEESRLPKKALTTKT